MPKVSVIVPVYNGSDYIISTLDQILRSTIADDIEVITINDGSTDSSAELLKDYVKTHPNVIYVEKENGGIVSARNRGLKEATGEYICFCDQDDIIPENAYEEMYKRAVSDGSELVLSSTVRYIDGETTPLDFFDDRIYEKDEVMDNLVLPMLLHGTDYTLDPAHEKKTYLWKSMIKKSMIDEYDIKFRRYYNYEDDEIYLIDCELRANKITTLPLVGYMWRINLGSETYRWKYIENFDERYMGYVYDVIDMLRRGGCPEEKVKLVLMYKTLDMYEQYILNQGSYRNKTPLGGKIKNIKANVKKYEQEGMYEIRKHLYKSSVRRRYSMIFLQHKMYFIDYCWLVGYKKLRERAIRKSTWFKLERYFKSKGK